MNIAASSARRRASGRMGKGVRLSRHDETEPNMEAPRTEARRAGGR